MTISKESSERKWKQSSKNELQRISKYLGESENLTRGRHIIVEEKQPEGEEFIDVQLFRQIARNESRIGELNPSFPCGGRGGGPG